MPPKHPPRRGLFFAMLALCAGITVLRAVDLLRFTDPATGYATHGPALLRYAVPAAALLVIWLVGGGIAQNAAALRGRRPALQGAGLLFAAGSLGAAVTALPDIGTLGGLLAVVCPLLAAAVMAVIVFSRTVPPAPLCAAGLLPLFLLLLLRRAMLEPMAISRVPATLRVLSAAAALVLAAALLRMACVPEQPGGQKLFRAGFAAFLFCTCLEGQQTLYELTHVEIGAGAVPAVLWTGAALAAFGLCGLVCAWYAAGGMRPPHSQGPAHQPPKN